MYIFSVLYGFFAGSSQGVYGPAVASLTKDPAKMGTRFGMTSSMMSLAVLAGPPTAGALIDVSGGEYTWAQVWGGSSMLLGAAMVAAARAWITGGRFFVKA
jgi:MFS family permease